VIRVHRGNLESDGDRRVIVDVGAQRAYLLVDGRVAVTTPVSTARSGKHTPRGSFRITERIAKGKTSSIYGCEMPYWMRLNGSAYGLHVGELPGYPASAGCVRLPWAGARLMFQNTGRGTHVEIVDSWVEPTSLVASR
jgi:lipoprotein-anchoring transpeptidase ErfK/SrfK